MGKIRTLLDICASISMIIAAGVLVWVVGANGLTEPSGSRAALGAAVDVENENIELAVPNGVGQRLAKGRLAMIEFSDYQCPFCGQYVRETLSELKRNFVDTGKVDYFFFNFPLEGIHPLAFGASEAGECARLQNRFWEMHHLLFQNQSALARPSLLGYAQKLNLDMDDFEACLEGKTATKIRDDIRQGQRVGVSSTPTFLIGRIQHNEKARILRVITGAVGYEAVARTLNELIEERVAAMQ